jgi:histidinol dehydrogenase
MNGSPELQASTHIYLKRAAATEKADRTRVETVVRDMLARIEDERDAAVRDYASTLDGWGDAQFRVSQDKIRNVASPHPSRVEA